MHYILASMDARHHGCARDMSVMLFLASMDARDHGCTRDMNVMLLVSMDAAIMDALYLGQHGCSPSWMR